MAGLDRLVIGGERHAIVDAAAPFGLAILEPAEQFFGVGDLEIPFRHLLFIGQEHVAIGDTGIIEFQVIDAVDALNIHGQPFEAVGEFARDRLAVIAAHLLEIGELRDFHAVAPHFPAKAPGTQRRAFPVILDKADVMDQGIDADFHEAAEIQLLQIGRAGLHDHLILVIMLQPVGVFAIAAVRGSAAGLDIGGVPRLRPKCAQRGGGVEGTRADFHVIGLEDDAALFPPIGMEGQDEVLEGKRFAFGHE